MQKNPTRQQRRGPAVIAATTRPYQPQPSSKTPAVSIAAASATTTAYDAADDILRKTQQQKQKQKKKTTKIENMGFRRTMRRWFGSRYKQMTNGEVKELDRQISAEMRAGTFRAVHRVGPRPATGDELWEAAAAAAADDYNNTPGAGAGARSPAVGQMLPPTMSGTSIIGMERPPTSISQRSRRTGGGLSNRYYDDEYGDDYGGYQDGGGYGSGNGSSFAYGGGGGASSDSGYYGRPTPPPLSSPLPMSPPPLQPQQLLYPKQPPPWYVPGGGPFDAAEAKPESVYDAAGSRANSMRSNITRASRRPPAAASPQQGLYYPPVRPGPYRDMSGNSRAYSMQSDPGRFYARSPRPPRVPYNNGMAQAAWDGQYYDGAGVGGGVGGLGVEGGHGGYEGGGGGGYGGYRGWNGDSNIGEHEYPVIDNVGYPGESYQYPGR
ncbi:hypothetical protein SLS53_004177 [Cytospora paraplurivora]|uniref:Uncharacterized protein n=1 Tax=Cytospora paraplurivora TaxID=2898453 RepID=A0AAN9U8E3_9PEZI